MKTYNITDSILDLNSVILDLQMAKGILKSSTAVHTTAGLHLIDEIDLAIFNSIERIKDIIANIQIIRQTNAYNSFSDDRRI